MGLRLTFARMISAVSTWGLKKVFRRPAANFPGKIALYVDPSLIADLAHKVEQGSIVVCGTNGKTTITNLLADALEAAGDTVICNRTGANLDSGVATALLHAQHPGWGVFESDELWLAKILPHLQADYLLLLNLFRDQLDRFAELDYIQDSIVASLSQSPKTVLIYNADDPLCAVIAQRAPNPSIAFGVNEDMHLDQNTIADAQMCQICSHMLDYEYRQYGQLGKFTCPNCGFKRAKLDFCATDIRLGAQGLSFAVNRGEGEALLSAPFSGAYMVYNLLAAYAAASLLGCPHTAFVTALDAFDPQNGRLESFSVSGRSVLLNLAKNPTGFNQNLKIIEQDTSSKVVAFFVNDREGDGHDVSWLWDVDFEELAGATGLLVYAGGIRKRDVQVRLKYADIESSIVDSVAEVFHDDTHASVNVYVIANYTALPAVRSELAELADPKQSKEASR